MRYTAREVISGDRTDVAVELSDVFSLEDTLTSGQTFRWLPEDGGFFGIVGERAVFVSQENNTVIFRDTDLDVFESFWCGYFGFDTDYEEIREKLSSDRNVREALDYCGGIHIMKQPLWETTISFIISANNNIPRIMGIIDRLSAKYGKEMTVSGRKYYSFPEPCALAAATVEELHALGTGYRDVYIKKTAEAFASGEFDADRLMKESYPEAKKHIMELAGVGPKVADCILLFAAEKTDAFPVDVWVKKVVCRLYLKDEDEKTVSPKKIEQFAAKHFPEYAGYAQQVLFHYIRTKKQDEEKEAN